MKLPVLLLASILPLTATPENPLIPPTWFQEIAATDGSTQHSVIFTTVPGVEYTFFHSHDLVEWTEIGKTYGLGHEFAAAMFETAPVPPPPDPENPPASPPVLANASITIQPSSGTAGGTVVSWASLDHGNAVSTLIAGNMAPDWNTVPLFAASSGGHQFFITHFSGTRIPPEENPQLEELDAAMIADLEACWAGFNTAMATSAETARNTPPPPPPAVDARGFWRIKADWSLDSDNDGSPDHLEFALAAQAPGADGLAGDAFNADTNGDGIPDGEQLDSDGDGIPDAQDIAPNDDGVAYTMIPLPRYAMFTFTDTPDGSFAINNWGTVLFPGKVWKAGVFQNLITGQNQITGYPLYPDGYPVIRSRAINDNDVIIGSGKGFLENHAQGVDSPHFTPILHWATPTAIPKVVSSTAGSVTTYADLWTNRYVTHLDNAGNFLSSSLLWDSERTTAGPDVGEWKKWTIPQAGGALTSVPAAEFSKGIASEGIVWGSEYTENPENGNLEWVLSQITSPTTIDIPIDPKSLLAQGSGTNLVATTASSKASTVIRKGDEWRVSPLLANALDLADNGTAIGKRVASKEIAPSILLNGKWTGLERAVPGIPERWKTSPVMSLSDTSPGGWILAHDRPGGTDPDDISAALLPLRAKGRYMNSANAMVERAVGVDDFSIGSTDPASSTDNIDHVQDRIWIMAPQGGAAKDVILSAPIHLSASIKLSAPGITFHGGEGHTCSGIENELRIAATSDVESGAEILLAIKSGTQESVSKPIGLKVMKERVVKVVVWKVASDRNPPGVLPGNPAYQLPLKPTFSKTEAELNNYLNDIYKPQINARFECQYRDVAVRFDTSDGTPYGAPANELSPGNGSLDIVSGLNNEFDAIFEAGYDVNISINIYLVAVSGNITKYRWLELNQFLKYSSYHALADPPRRLAAIACGFASDEAKVMDTTAHEIGHILLEEGHPDTNNGVAPLPGTRHEERLMCSGPKRRKDGSSRLLVKAEWDEAEAWFEAEQIRLDNLPPQ